MRKNTLYFDKEKKLKITAALLVALSGILAGIVDLFSNCGCCCVNVNGLLRLSPPSCSGFGI